MLRVEEGPQALLRANLYCDPEIKKNARQLKPDRKKVHSVGRMKALDSVARNQKGPATVRVIQDMLCDKRVFIDLKGRSLTLAQFVADCKKGILYCRDSSHDAALWKRYNV